jgi:hypothetical protein
MDHDAENLMSCSPNLQMVFLQDGCRRTGRDDSVATISGVDTRVRFRKDFLSGPRVNVVAEQTSSLSRFLLKYTAAGKLMSDFDQEPPPGPPVRNSMLPNRMFGQLIRPPHKSFLSSLIH